MSRWLVVQCIEPFFKFNTLYTLARRIRWWIIHTSQAKWSIRNARDIQHILSAWQFIAFVWLVGWRWTWRAQNCGHVSANSVRMKCVNRNHKTLMTFLSQQWATTLQIIFPTKKGRKSNNKYPIINYNVFKKHFSTIHHFCSCCKLQISHFRSLTAYSYWNAYSKLARSSKINALHSHRLKFHGGHRNWFSIRSKTMYRFSLVTTAAITA